jgi:hypothetical protein
LIISITTCKTAVAGPSAVVNKLEVVSFEASGVLQWLDIAGIMQLTVDKFEPACISEIVSV